MAFFIGRILLVSCGSCADDHRVHVDVVIVSGACIPKAWLEFTGGIMTGYLLGTICKTSDIKLGWNND